MSTPEVGHGESLVAILDELWDLVASARAMPMSASALINRAEVLELIESAKAVLPSQIAQADVVIADADAVLERARRDAGRIVEKARTRGEELVAEQHVVAEANARAEQILAEAAVAAEKLSRDADDFCDRQLAQFEIDLNAIGTQVAAGRARLDERARGRGDRPAATPRAAEGEQSRRSGRRANAEERSSARGPVRTSVADRGRAGSPTAEPASGADVTKDPLSSEANEEDGR